MYWNHELWRGHRRWKALTATSSANEINIAQCVPSCGKPSIQPSYIYFYRIFSFGHFCNLRIFDKELLAHSCKFTRSLYFLASSFLPFSFKSVNIQFTYELILSFFKTFFKNLRSTFYFTFFLHINLSIWNIARNNFQFCLHGSASRYFLKLQKKKSFLIVAINNILLEISCCFFNLRLRRLHLHMFEYFQSVGSQLTRDWK